MLSQDELTDRFLSKYTKYTLSSIRLNKGDCRYLPSHSPWVSGYETVFTKLCTK